MTKPTAVTDATFDAEVMKSDLIVMADFWAEWCTPCAGIAPQLAELAAEYPDQIKVVSIDINENPNTTATYEVLKLPTMIAFRNGLEIARLGGTPSKREFLAAVKPYFSS